MILEYYVFRIVERKIYDGMVSQTNNHPYRFIDSIIESFIANIVNLEHMLYYPFLLISQITNIVNDSSKICCQTQKAKTTYNYIKYCV